MLIGINIVTKMINEIPINEMLHPKSIYHQNENPVLLYRVFKFIISKFIHS